MFKLKRGAHFNRMLSTYWPIYFHRISCLRPTFSNLIRFLFLHLIKRQQSGSASLHAYSMYTSNTCTICTKEIPETFNCSSLLLSKAASSHASQGTRGIIQHLCNEPHFSSIFKFAINPCSRAPVMHSLTCHPFH